MEERFAREKCLRCNHSWLLKDSAKKPKVCPKCKSAYWDRPIQHKGTSEASKAWWKEHRREMSQKTMERIARKKELEKEQAEDTVCDKLEAGEDVEDYYQKPKRRKASK